MYRNPDRLRCSRTPKKKKLKKVRRIPIYGRKCSGPLLTALQNFRTTMGNRLAWTRTCRFIMKFKQVASKEEDSIEKKFDFNVVHPRGLLETARTFIQLDDFSDTNPRSFEQLCVTRYLLY